MVHDEKLAAPDAGALVKKRRKERGLTQEQLVERTGLSSQSYLSALEKGRYHIGRSEHFGAIAKALSLSEEDIRAINPSAVINMTPPTAREALGQCQEQAVEMIADLHRIPVRGMAAAGSAFYTEDNIIDYEYVTADEYRLGMLAVQIEGDSMEPTVPHGSRVYVDVRLTDPQDGKMYLIHINENGFVVKRAKLVGDSWLLLSDNPMYQAFTPDSAKLVGQVYFVQPRGWRA